MKLRIISLFAAIGLLFSLGCSGQPAFVRGSDVPELDNFALSTGMDKKDLERLFNENAKSLQESGIMRKWKRWSMEDKEASVSISQIANQTTEHIDGELKTLLSKFETQLANSGFVRVIDQAAQLSLIENMKKQQSAAFDPDNAAQLGKAIGVKYIITGKLYTNDEKSGRERRVQYFLFMRVLEVETGAVRWQNEANLTKGLIN